MMWVGAPTL